MRYFAVLLLIATAALCGCNNGRGPRLAMRQEDTSRSSKLDAPMPPPVAKHVNTKAPPGFQYQGRTVEQWALALNGTDQESVGSAADALRVIGAPGRPYLIQGLENASPETRRICLENLTVSDLRVYGDHGKQLLVKLSGDPYDCRIRERSAGLLMHWQDAVPARP